MSDALSPKLFGGIDQALKVQGVDIPVRPMFAVCLLQRKMGTREEWTLESAPAKAVFAWYEREYGDKLKHDFRPGRLAVLVQGDPYMMHIPAFVGRPPLFIVADMPPRVGGPSDGTYNILDSIVGLTAARRQMTREQCKSVSDVFLLGREAYEKLFSCLLQLLLAKAKGSEVYKLLNQAREDHLSTADMIIRGDLGQARFQALQAAEKSIKACCSAYGHAFSKTHDLAKLADQVRPTVSLPANLLSAVQCDADVRYGSASRPEETVAGHHAALKISALLAPVIQASVKK